MSDNVSITPGSGNTIAADEVIDGTLGTVKVQYVKIMDGTLDGTSKAAVGSNGLKIDGSSVTQPISAVSLPLPTGASTSANQITASNSLSSIDSKTATLVSGRVPVDPSGVTSPISGTVTANAGTNLNTSLLALDSTLTNSTQKTKLVDSAGTNVATIDATGDLQVDVNNAISITAANLSVTATGVAAAAVTLTLPAVAGQFHYITGIEIEAYSSAARTGGTTPVLVTSTNLPGGNVWTFASAAAIGTTDTKWYQTCNPIKSSIANTTTTIVCPATTSIIWRVNVYYYTAA